MFKICGVIDFQKSRKYTEISKRELIKRKENNLWKLSIILQTVKLK